MDSPSVYIPMDRRQAMAHGRSLPDRAQGTALFADVRGFTPLTEALARELGPQRGSEEITRHLNLVFDAVITEVHRQGGSVIGFSGDAITCWFDQDNGLRAIACALAMQQAMAGFAEVVTPSGQRFSLGLKTSAACGPARRFLVGNPERWLIEVLAGRILDRLAEADHHTEGGEVVLDPVTASTLAGQVEIAYWRQDEHKERAYAVVKGLRQPPPLAEWPALADDAIHGALARPWLQPAVYERLRSGLGEFLAELRPAVSLFMSFTGIDYDNDPEAEHKLDHFIQQVQAIVAQYEGSLIQLTIGDKGSYLYAAFGAPVAHEDDAQRAASTALALRALAQRTDYIVETKLGIAQGRMRTGAYGGRAMRTYGVLGNATNLAARLMQAAAPGQILASKLVYETVGDVLVWEALPAIRVKGRSDPVAICELVGEQPRRGSRSLLETFEQTPLIGRTDGMELIAQKMALAANGHGQVIGFTGEAGMGKSRLAAEAARQADARGWLCYDSECSSFGINTSYHAWHAIWWQFFEIDPTQPLPAQIESIENQLRQIDPALTPRLPLLGTALNLPIADNDLTVSFDAKLRKASLEALLVDCLRARSQQKPVLLIVDNCQWLDPLSYDLLEVVARALVGMPVLLLLAYRPPELAYLQEPRISGLAHYADSELAPFTPQEAERLITSKLCRAYNDALTIPPELVVRITERAGGNPFFIDELLGYLQAQGVDPLDPQALARLDLPTSLQSLILTRLDQLADSPRITLKVASVVGRSFEATTLWGFYPSLGGEQQVKHNLIHLEKADLTFQEAPEPDLVYAFRQVLTQEVSYESLPYATRAALHEQLGEFIERAFSDQLDQHLDRLAYHYGASQNEAKKREYLLKAGERAQRAYNNEAAIDYFQRVLPLLQDDQKPPVMLKLGQVLDLVGRWQEAGETLDIAFHLAERLDDLRAIAQCETALGDHHRKRGQLQEALQWLERAQSKFQMLDDLEGYGQALHYAATATTLLADYERARSLFETSMAVRERLDDQTNIASLYSNLGIVARREGNNALARVHYERSLEIRRKLDDRWAIGVSLNNLGHLALTEGNYAEAQSQLERALAIWREVGDRWAIANTLIELGNLARERSAYNDAAALYGESLAINRELDDKLAIAYLFEDIGCLAALQDAPKRALRLVAAAATVRESVGAPLAPAEANRLQEKLARVRQQLSWPEQQAAEDEGRALSFEQAIELATHWTEN